MQDLFAAIYTAPVYGGILKTTYSTSDLAFAGAEESLQSVSIYLYQVRLCLLILPHGQCAKMKIRNVSGLSSAPAFEASPNAKRTEAEALIVSLYLIDIPYFVSSEYPAF